MSKKCFIDIQKMFRNTYVTIWSYAMFTSSLNLGYIWNTWATVRSVCDH